MSETINDSVSEIRETMKETVKKERKKRKRETANEIWEMTDKEGQIKKKTSKVAIEKCT